MAVLRRDAARNRERILQVARALTAEGATVQLNAVAHRAEVGVGTVYRHFPTVEALREGLAEQRFDDLDRAARAALAAPDPLDGLRRFLDEALRVYVADPSFAEVSVAASPAREQTRVRRDELLDAVRALADAASARLRPGIDGADLMNLLCGVAYSARLRPDRGSVYLDAVLTGVLRST